MSKELIDRLLDYVHNVDDVALRVEAADLIEAQQKRIEQLEADTKEVNAARIFLREKEGLLRDLAASQAQIKVLRDCIRTVFDDVLMRDELYEMCEKALAQPTDDSALRELLKAERERCAKVLDERAMKNEQAAQDCLQNGEPEEVSSLRSAAWQMSVCAAAIRARGDSK